MPITLGRLLTHWTFEPSVVLGLAGLIAAFLWLQRQPALAVPAGRRALFGVAMGLLALALLSPLDEISDEYLLVAHMIQHLLMVLLITCRPGTRRHWWSSRCTSSSTCCTWAPAC